MTFSDLELQGNGECPDLGVLFNQRALSSAKVNKMGKENETAVKNIIRLFQTSLALSNIFHL
jgi:hypothetical protein